MKFNYFNYLLFPNFYLLNLFSLLTYFLRDIHRTRAQRQNVLNIIYATALLIAYASRLKSNTGLGDLLGMVLVLMAVSKEGSVIYSS